MEQTTLKKLRGIYPGVAVLIIAILLCRDDISDAMKTLTNLDFSMALPVMVIFSAGLIYYALNIRNVIWIPAMKKVGDNINRRLLEIAGISNATELSETQKNSIRNSVFYHFVDNDPSLTNKALNVRFNGFWLSSTVDNILIAPLGMVSFAIKALIQKQNLSVFFWIILIVLAISSVSFFLLLKKHISLSNEQIDIIKDNYEIECKNKIIEIIKSSRS